MSLCAAALGPKNEHEVQVGCPNNQMGLPGVESQFPGAESRVPSASIPGREVDRRMSRLGTRRGPERGEVKKLDAGQQRRM